ncbi:FRAS1-related extracellular matrix protein 2-like isoform X2 [Dreissena polymorpha]|nr:FRAS1-related extracellular matrix protein 2-like isoform X2 [Dreissena polymorpha]
MDLITAITRVFVPLWIFTGIVQSEADVRKADVVIVNRAVSVTQGRTVWLDPSRDLRLKVRAGNNCTVRAIDNEVNLYYKPGRLSKTEFPCTFTNSEIKYTHFGSESFTEDRLHLLIRYDSSSQTTVIPLVLVIKIVQASYEIVKKKQDLTVDDGSSQPLHNAVNFMFNSSLYSCRISILPDAYGLPLYGNLLSNGLSLTNIDCQDFQKSDIRYKFTSQQNGLNFDYIALHVRIFNKNMSTIKEEYFQLTVNSYLRQANTHPHASLNAIFVMEAINKFTMTAITPDIVSGVDDHTPPGRLIFNISLPLGPGEGSIVNTDDPETPLQYFYQREVNDLKIAYKPPQSDSNINRMFQLWVTIVDSEGLSSAEIPLMIVVQPLNSLASILSIVKGLNLIEGQSKAISSPDSLEIAPGKVSDNIRIYRWEGLQHGHLTLPSGKKYFTPRDLEQGNVVYHHDNSDTYSDNIIFKMSDGSLEVTFLMPVIIFPKDDMIPTLSINTGVDVIKSGIVALTPLSLVASDRDSSSITFFLVPPFSSLGIIFMRQYECPENSSIWQFENGSFERFVSVFTQHDIMQGKIFYKQTGEHANVAFTDEIKFKLKDDAIPPNESPVYELVVRVKPVDDTAPFIYPNTLLQIEVGYNRLTELRKKNLRFTDDESNDREVKYTVTQIPEDMYTNSLFDSGKIVHCESPWKPVDQFTQGDVNQLKICYQPPSAALSINTRIINFYFNVEDKVGNKLENQKFTIVIKPLSDTVPEVINKGAVIDEKGQVVIEPDALYARDKETEKNNVKFVLQSVPSFGSLYKEGKVLSVTDSFSITDIDNKHILYKKAAVNKRYNGDKVALIVSDGIHRVPITLKINAGSVNIPTNMQAPRIIHDNPIHVVEGQKVAISQKNVRVLDDDGDLEQIFCVVKTQPLNGFFTKSANNVALGTPISAFAAEDINRGDIWYVQSIHKGVEPVTDKFGLQCSDGKNVGKDTVIDVVIEPTNDEVPKIQVKLFAVSEGMDIRIDQSVLSVTDADVPVDNLTFIIIRPPNHGRIVKQLVTGDKATNHFTVADIQEMLAIAYEHDGSETSGDSFECVLTDGVHNVSTEVPILIIPVNDEAPRLAINTGLQIDALGDKKTITNEMLKAEDIDSAVDDLIFVLRSIPEYGVLIKAVSDKEQALMYGSNFTQHDIDNQLLAYKHFGKDSKPDRIMFDVSDGLNSLVNRHFLVTIKGMGSLYPKNVNLGIELQRNGMLVLALDILKGCEVDLHEENLEFKVTKAPKYGHLEIANKAKSEVLTFSSIDLLSDQVIYVSYPDIAEMKMDSLEIEVKDSKHLFPCTYKIALNSIENSLPVLLFKTILLEDGENKLITLADLQAMDHDTSDTDIIFTITQVPQHGNILRNYSEIVTKFSQHDIKEKVISYQHDGSGTHSDSFTFTISDGTHQQFLVLGFDLPTKKPQQMNIEIIPMDNNKPRVKVNTGTTSLKMVSSESLFQFSSQSLYCKGPNTDARDLRYFITVHPMHGYLRNSVRGNSAIAIWTQNDIDEGRIQYVLYKGDNSTRDSFFFKVIDKDGHALENQPFQLQWCWVSFLDDLIRGNETQEVIEVTVLRRGYLGHTSAVTMEITEGTASLGQDLSRQFMKQVTFSAGQSERQWQVAIRDDKIFEREETVTLHLTDPQGALLRDPQVATITIHDPEDEGSVFFLETRLVAMENFTAIDIPVRRDGDLSHDLSVLCYTRNGRAQGTESDKADSSPDFVSRPQAKTSVIRFAKGENQSVCRVTVLDDSLYEEVENFHVILADATGGRIGKNSLAEIIIATDPADEPEFYFSEAKYQVDEGAGSLEVNVWKTGTDLSQPSSVTVLSGSAGSQPAEEGVDYIPVMKILDFVPGETTKTLRVTILDDLASPRLEGPETFHLDLQIPVGGRLAEPHRTVITMNDSLSDLPRMQFEAAEYLVLENERHMVAVVTRVGDLSSQSQVRCYTQSVTAKSGLDFVERPNTDQSLVVFNPGDMTSECVVQLVEDSVREQEQSFRLVLSAPSSSLPGGATLGSQMTTQVVIDDPHDIPRIMFEKNQFTVNEPIIKGDQSVAHISIVRLGDLSETSQVRVFTSSGTATSERDFNSVSKVAEFGPGVSRQLVDVEILYDTEHEQSETFTMQLSQDINMVALVGHNSRADVIIEEKSRLTNLAFPIPPVVMSLHDLDLERPSIDLRQGFPLICISPCDSRHPHFNEVEGTCRSQSLHDNQTKFRWRVGSHGNLSDLDSDTTVTSTRQRTLDSIYFTAGTSVQCFARAVSVSGEPGKETGSAVVAISPRVGPCQSRAGAREEGQPFQASLRYIGGDEGSNTHSIRLMVEVPHIDGTLPIVSTRQLSNMAFKTPGSRSLLHCSNIGFYGDANANITGFGFHGNSSRLPSDRYLYGYKMRDGVNPVTTLFYRNLDVKSCHWKFEASFDLPTLTSECGGRIEVDSQVSKEDMTVLVLKVPVFFSRLHFQPGQHLEWLRVDSHTTAQLRYVYTTPLPWRTGLQSNIVSSGLAGKMFPTSITVEDRRLVVSVTTETSFKGRFHLKHQDAAANSTVTSLGRPDLVVDLRLVATTEETTQQHWQFIFRTLLTDYSGKYEISLLPCTTTSESPGPISCSPVNPVTFNLPLTLQPISDLVPTRLILDTRMRLMRRREEWMEGGGARPVDQSVAFAPGDTVYGRLDTQPPHQSAVVTVSQVLVCCGRQGYIPHFNPQHGLYGCAGQTENLHTVLRILDVDSPHLMDRQYNGLHFNAESSLTTTTFTHTSDGFLFDPSPLFRGEEKSLWFVQVIFSLHTDTHTATSRTRKLQSTESNKREKGPNDDIPWTGSSVRGTNMALLVLDRERKPAKKRGIQSDQIPSQNDGQLPIIAALIGAGVLLLIGLFIIVIYIRHRRKQTSPPPTPSGTITVMSTSPGHTKVISNIHTFKPGNPLEV